MNFLNVTKWRLGNPTRSKWAENPPSFCSYWFIDENTSNQEWKPDETEKTMLFKRTGTLRSKDTELRVSRVQDTFSWDLTSNLIKAKESVVRHALQLQELTILEGFQKASVCFYWMHSWIQASIFHQQWQSTNTTSQSSVTKYKITDVYWTLCIKDAHTVHTFTNIQTRSEMWISTIQQMFDSTHRGTKANCDHMIWEPADPLKMLANTTKCVSAKFTSSSEASEKPLRNLY